MVLFVEDFVASAAKQSEEAEKAELKAEEEKVTWLSFVIENKCEKHMFDLNSIYIYIVVWVFVCFGEDVQCAMCNNF